MYQNNFAFDIVESILRLNRAQGFAPLLYHATTPNPLPCLNRYSATR
ncbi:hypothetical protein MC7420_8018 [Coleofasciculus chthonoplastes PCC 7420]|uniref:Uncharacterized protein n=1 Tax=Coleofasciculus chthonoplastes PCC 7420 TaxID=118168 RepID=B4VIT0_9CYAN|nr:hypothetical protein MC7420_8018 [Coleofasciculus chthonoplastes PCC 7420]